MSLMRICSIVGARPQFVKLGVLCRALSQKEVESWRHIIIHTGQHYDPGLSAVFFDELTIPRPDHNLGIGSGSHGQQTADMLKGLEPVLAAERPDWVVLYGDTNSTLAGALAAAKMDIRIAHVEAGLRSYRRAMPEEINRIVADHLSDLLLCPTRLAVENLRKEGLGTRAVFTGDVMYDAALAYRRVAESREGMLSHTWKPSEFALATVHRAENTDEPQRLRAIIQILDRVSRTICPVLWPIHPRTRKRLQDLGCSCLSVHLIEPVSYLDMLLLEGRSRFILTDSGGVQKEAYFFQTPCITLRDETEWVETLRNHCNVLTGCNEDKVMQAISEIPSAGPWLPEYGDGDSGRAIVDALARRTGRKRDLTSG